MSRSSKGKKDDAPKGPPAPYPVQKDVWVAMNRSVTCSTMDENPQNPFNNNPQPPSLLDSRGRPTGFVLMHPNLIKSWLKVLATSSLFGREAKCEKTLLTKSGKKKYESELIMSVRVLRIPTIGEIENFYRSQNIPKEEMRDEIEDKALVAKVISTRLLPTVPSAIQLTDGSNIHPDRMYRKEVLATPDNIVKMNRWEHLYPNKLSVVSRDGSMEKAWNDYYNSETLRLRSFSTPSGSRTRDSTLKSLGNDEAMQHNMNAITALTPNDDDLDQPVRRMEGMYVSPVTIFNSSHPAVKPVSKRKKHTREDYKELIREYLRLTGAKLDLNDEIEQELYVFREQELEWARGMRAERGSVQFGHDRNTNRLYLMNYDVKYPVAGRPSSPVGRVGSAIPEKKEKVEHKLTKPMKSGNSLHTFDALVFGKKTTDPIVKTLPAKRPSSPPKRPISPAKTIADEYKVDVLREHKEEHDDDEHDDEYVDDWQPSDNE